MTHQTIDAPTTHPGRGSHRRGSLAIAFQEVITVSIRVRAKRQAAADADSFRAHVKNLLAIADRDARQAGYDPEYVKLAVYATIALLDESVLNSNQPMFASWPRQSLQEEVFGDHIAGENFFVHLQDLMARQDSEDLADLLEVFHLCLLLGFRGRYAFAADGGTERIAEGIHQKIRRIRGQTGPLSPVWALPTNEVVPTTRDRWVPRLAFAAAGSFVFSLVLYFVYRIMLNGGIGDLQTLASQLIR
jgi:type VI secretion system protein ImpK